MGWLFGWNTRRELIAHLTRNEQDEWTSKGQTDKILVNRLCLKHCFKGSPFKGTLWTVWEITRTRPGEDQPYETDRYIGCDLLQYYREHRWGYKDLCESMGPCQINCPLSYLDLVPVANAEWREKVKRYHVKLHIGQQVKLHDTCKPNQIIVHCVRPLKGKSNDGIVYRFQRSQIERVMA